MTSSRKIPLKRTPETRPEPKPLKGRVALAAGATRGVGRGIALALGEAGATVYCTGRSSRSARSASASPGRGVAERSGKERQKLWPAEYYAERPETIEETAELVTGRGRKGIAVVVDHLAPEQVEKLVERIHSEQGKLNILVNDISESAEYEFGQTFWNIDLERGEGNIFVMTGGRFCGRRENWFGEAVAFVARIGRPLAEKLRDTSLAIYKSAAEFASVRDVPQCDPHAHHHQQIRGAADDRNGKGRRHEWLESIRCSRTGRDRRSGFSPMTGLSSSLFSHRLQRRLRRRAHRGIRCKHRRPPAQAKIEIWVDLLACRTSAN